MISFLLALESGGVRVHEEQLEAEGAARILDGPPNDYGFHGNYLLKQIISIHYKFTSAYLQGLTLSLLFHTSCCTQRCLGFLVF